MYKSIGIVSMSKRMFWPMFQASWNEAFTSANITFAFAKTGVFPFDSSKTLIIIQKKEELQKLLINPPTPMSSWAIQRIQKAYNLEPSKEKLELLFRAANRLAAQHSIDEHEKKGLREALQLEKKKRSQSKRLNLLGEEDVGPQFFSPARVRAAIAFQAAKEAEEQQRKDSIAERKAQATAVREQKEADKAARALQQVIRRQVAQEARHKRRLRRELEWSRRRLRRGKRRQRGSLQRSETARNVVLDKWFRQRRLCRQKGSKWWHVPLRGAEQLRNHNALINNLILNAYSRPIYNLSNYWFSYQSILWLLSYNWFCSNDNILKYASLRRVRRYVGISVITNWEISLIQISHNHGQP